MTVTLPYCTDPSGVHFTPSLATIIPGEPLTIKAELCVPIVPTGTADSYLKVLLQNRAPRLSISVSELEWDGNDPWPPPAREFLAAVAPDDTDFENAIVATVESSMVGYNGKMAPLTINAATNKSPPPAPITPPSPPPPPSKPSPPSKPPSPPRPPKSPPQSPMPPYEPPVPQPPPRPPPFPPPTPPPPSHPPPSPPPSRVVAIQQLVFMFFIPIAVFLFISSCWFCARRSWDGQGARHENHRGIPVERSDQFDWNGGVPQSRKLQLRNEKVGP